MGNASDVLRLERQENRLCELVCGVLVEKRLGYKEMSVAAALLEALQQHVRQKQLGVVTGPDGFYRLGDHLVRVPSVAFCAADSFPGDATPGEAAAGVIPQFVAEVTDGMLPGELTRRQAECFSDSVLPALVRDGIEILRWKELEQSEQEQLQKLFLETGTTTVLVSHDLEEAVYLADRVLLLSRHPARVADFPRLPSARPRTDATLSEPDFVSELGELAAGALPPDSEPDLVVALESDLAGAPFSDAPLPPPLA